MRHDVVESGTDTRFRFRMLPEPGDITSRTRTLIVTACAVTVVLALYGMQAMWEAVEWVEDSYLDGVIAPGRSQFWYTNGLGLAMCVALALAWCPRFHISKLLRVAVVLPILHVAAIAAAAYVWSIFDADALANIRHAGINEFVKHPSVPLPSVGALAIGFAAVVVGGVAIKRRHGEWAHASVMLALSYLLLLGMWLPVVARIAVHASAGEWGYLHVVRVLDADTLAILATIPPALVAVAFVAIVFRDPRLFERFRPQVRFAAGALLVIAIVVAMSLPDIAWIVYLESSYLVMSAIVLAVAALVLLAAVSWLRPLRARWRSRRLVYEDGVIASDEQGDVACFEITSWLRGPQLMTRPFVVTTKHGDIPIAGANVLVPVPRASTLLEVGEHVGVLAPGSRVVIASRRTASGGHPFRASGAAEISLVSAPELRSRGSSDLTLVVWRPAVAYLAILTAVAAPFLSIFLTD